ncbi:MAG TPA: hypothetical protein VMO26_08690 [Vicinamibacterales bacterium]|nr:hypothetical protein [Vicinamibacterales bacterium]
MPVILAALLLILFLILASVVLIPITLVMRYRAGTARRPVRRWLATVNAAGIGLSIGLFVTASALTNIWVPDALVYACAGLVGGAVVGLLGLLLTRWEVRPGVVHYTPNRWLVLAITLGVTGRLAYGFWRSWNAWQSLAGDTSWAADAGVAGSLAAGAVILGYYFTYWLGVRSHSPRLRN